MLKLLGSACLLGGACLIIWQHRLDHRRRQDTLTDLISVLRRLEAEIRMERPPLPQLLARLAEACKPDTSEFLRTVSENHGENLQSVWRKAAEKLPLSHCEKRTVEMLGNQLHASEENICKAISLACDELVKHREKWDKQRPEEEKRTAALCMSGAALLVILLI